MPNTVAQTILDQLGGPRFLAMTGAKGLTGRPDSLTFTIPGNMTRKRANMFRVRLDPSDTYTVELLKYSPKNLTLSLLETQSDVYCDELQERFTAMTGLYTRL